MLAGWPVRSITIKVLVLLLLFAAPAAARSYETAEIQMRLGKYYTGEIDGIYGPKTEQAVRNFQRDYDLQVDGIAGPETKAALPEFYGIHDLTDWLYLAHVIRGEARGEPRKGQVAVAAVVLNRVESEHYPDTVKEVVLQEGQFCSVEDGQYAVEPLMSHLIAAAVALSGYDPTGGALFFYNPSSSNPAWARSMTVTQTIGNHVFLRG